MSGVKELLLKQTIEAFSGRPDLPIKAALLDITQGEASWRPGEAIPTAEELVRHVAWAKSWYCREAFGKPMPLEDAWTAKGAEELELFQYCPCGAGWGRGQTDDICQAIGLLDQAQGILTECLDSCSEESLDRPIPTRHGKSAAHFFWIMAMHDLYHAGQIRTRRTMYGLK
jgi:hypothetical protein